MSKFHGVGSRARHAVEMSELIGQFDPGRETQIAFCRKHGLSLSTFLYWRRRLDSREPAPSRFVEVTVDPGAREEQGFEVLVGGA
jgi:hypothetical protein